MEPEHIHMWGNGWPIFPMIMMFFFFMMFRRGGGFKPPCRQDSNRHQFESATSGTALDILKKRYVKSEITKKEFEEMKRYLSSLKELKMP